MPHKTIEARREYHRKWSAAHPDYAAAASRKRRQLHPESAREEYLKHKASYIARAKAWQAVNPEKAKASKLKAGRKAHAEKPEVMRHNQRIWRAKNPDKVKASQDRAKPRRVIASKAWKRNNKHKLSIYKRKRTLAGKTAEQDHRRRARLNAVGCEDCTGAVQRPRRERFCRWCCITLTPDNFSIDHIIPLSRGGHHKPDNLAAACMTCNLSKGNKFVREWTWEAA